VVVTGGAHPTAVPKQMSDAFDVVVVGEGEQAFVDMLEDVAV